MGDEQVGKEGQLQPGKASGGSWAAVIIGGALAVFVLVASLSGGLPAVAVNAGLIGFFTGLWVFVTGRRSWLRLPGRATGMLMMVISPFIAGAGAAGLSGSLLAGAIVLGLLGLLFLLISGGNDGLKAMGTTGVVLALVASIISMAVAPSGQKHPVAGTRALWDGTMSRVAFLPGQEAAAFADETTPEAEASPSALPDSLKSSPHPTAQNVRQPTKAPYNPLATARFASALEQLDRIPIKGRAPKTGYDRDEFGTAWYDQDRNGCKTREDILRRDLRDVVIAPGTRGCVVKSGILDDPYTATTIPYEGKDSATNFVGGAGTDTPVQIDHVVALSDAWQKGAQLLPRKDRVAFANDPLNLLAVDAGANRSKGDSDAATWLPPNRAFWCEYVAIQTAVKAKYGLWMTLAEADRIREILTSDCDNQPVPEEKPVPAPSETTPTPTPTPEPVPEPVQEAPYIAPVPEPEPYVDPNPYVPPAAPYIPPAPAPAPPPPANVYYANCDAVRAAGAAPIYPWSPGWQPKFDRNNDGVGCE